MQWVGNDILLWMKEGRKTDAHTWYKICLLHPLSKVPRLLTGRQYRSCYREMLLRGDPDTHMHTTEVSILYGCYVIFQLEQQQKKSK